MKGQGIPRVCLCASSVAWIMRNLKKSAKSAFRKMISKNKIAGSGGR